MRKMRHSYKYIGALIAVDGSSIVMSGADRASDSGPISEEAEDLFIGLLRDGRLNAVLAWLIVAVLVTVFIESLLDFDRLWIVFVGFSGGVILLPPIAKRDVRTMLPWELLVLAMLPILVRGIFGGQIETFSMYLSIAGLALIITVELHMFTNLRVTHWFAIGLVVLATLATVAVWTILRWNADLYLGTRFLTDNTALMIEWIYVTLAGLAGGIIFDVYFKDRDSQLWRLFKYIGRR